MVSPSQLSLFDSNSKSCDSYYARFEGNYRIQGGGAARLTARGVSPVSLCSKVKQPIAWFPGFSKGGHVVVGQLYVSMLCRHGDDVVITHSRLLATAWLVTRPC
jgi:hypothetical protein